MTEAPAAPRHPLPGDLPPAARLARMIRVDHAGEYGAVRIYEGQLAVLGRARVAAPIREMAAHEKRHLAAFERLVPERRVRPTALMPLWHLAGFALGAATALMGERAAMACTVAVEEAIDGHYRRQEAALAEAGEDGLRALVGEFREEELAHRDLALAHGAKETPGYELLGAVIKAGSRLAIWLSERV